MNTIMRCGGVHAYNYAVGKSRMYMLSDHPLPVQSKGMEGDTLEPFGEGREKPL